MYGLIQGGGIAPLKIGTTTSADEDGVPGEGTDLLPIVQYVGHAAIGVAGGGPDFDGVLSHRKRVAIAERNVRTGYASASADGSFTPCPCSQASSGGHMVCVDVGVEAVTKLKVQLTQEPEVAFKLLHDGIDQHRFSAIGQKVGVGARFGIEELTEDHGEASLDSLSVPRHRDTDLKKPGRLYRPGFFRSF